MLVIPISLPWDVSGLSTCDPHYARQSNRSRTSDTAEGHHAAIMANAFVHLGDLSSSGPSNSVKAGYMMVIAAAALFLSISRWGRREARIYKVE